MRTLGTLAVLALLALAAEAHADTVYLKDGQTVWGQEVTEDGDTVIVTRPGGTLRFPKREVTRIERWRLSVPRYYEPPTGAAAAEGPPPTQPPTPGAPTTPQAPRTVTPPAQNPPAVAAPGGPSPTVLPPPPPPRSGTPQ
jgi:hypothetical protein